MTNYLDKWRYLDPEILADIEAVMRPHQAPIRIDKAYAQKLTTWTNPFNPDGQGQFVFDIGQQPRTRIKLNFSWGNIGPGGTPVLNRWHEELAYLLRNQKNVKILKATAYLPNTQEFLTWCQFLEVRQYGEPKACYVIWNGELIIESKANPIWREQAQDWTFDWRNSQTLSQALESVAGLD